MNFENAWRFWHNSDAKKDTAGQSRQKIERLYAKKVGGNQAVFGADLQKLKAEGSTLPFSAVVGGWTIKTPEAFECSTTPSKASKPIQAPTTLPTPPRPQAAQTAANGGGSVAGSASAFAEAWQNKPTNPDRPPQNQEVAKVAWDVAVSRHGLDTVFRGVQQFCHFESQRDLPRNLATFLRLDREIVDYAAIPMPKPVAPGERIVSALEILTAANAGVEWQGPAAAPIEPPTRYVSALEILTAANNE